MKIESGSRFGRLVVISDDGPRNVRCKCDCGNIKITWRKCLRKGTTASCGCLHREILIKMSMHHGESKTRLYRIWKTMKMRATNPHVTGAKNYVLRGITLCSEWNSYELFRDWSVANGYRDDLTIDRIDNDGPYAPENCRWITQKEQCRNKRNNHSVEYKGVFYKTLKGMCEVLGLDYRNVQGRLNHGWTVEDAIELGRCKTGPRKKGQSIKDRERIKT